MYFEFSVPSLIIFYIVKPDQKGLSQWLVFNKDKRINKDKEPLLRAGLTKSNNFVT